MDLRPCASRWRWMESRRDGAGGDARSRLSGESVCVTSGGGPGSSPETEPEPLSAHNGAVNDRNIARWGKDDPHWGGSEDVPLDVDPREDGHQLHATRGEMEGTDARAVKDPLAAPQRLGAAEGDLADAVDEFRRRGRHAADPPPRATPPPPRHPRPDEDHRPRAAGEVDEAAGPYSIQRPVAPPRDVDVALGVCLEQPQDRHVEALLAHPEDLGRADHTLWTDRRAEVDPGRGEAADHAGLGKERDLVDHAPSVQAPADFLWEPDPDVDVCPGADVVGEDGGGQAGEHVVDGTSPRRDAEEPVGEPELLDRLLLRDVALHREHGPCLPVRDRTGLLRPRVLHHGVHRLGREEDLAPAARDEPADVGEDDTAVAPGGEGSLAALRDHDRPAGVEVPVLVGRGEVEERHVHLRHLVPQPLLRDAHPLPCGWVYHGRAA